MKYLALIMISLLVFSCENKGKKVIKSEIQTEETTETETKNILFKGTIMNAEDSSSLSMALIIVPGTNIGTMSDPNGKFTISAPDGTKKLAIVMDGYEKATIEVNSEEQNNIYLAPKSE